MKIMSDSDKSNDDNKMGCGMENDRCYFMLGRVES